MSAVQDLYAKMEEMGVRLGGLTLAPGKHDPEVVAKELLGALEQMERGECEPAYFYDSDEIWYATGLPKEKQDPTNETARKLYAEAYEARSNRSRCF